jgi:hypothetical protein
MIAENSHTAFQAVGQAALKALLELARTKGNAKVHEHEVEVGRKVLAALTPIECGKTCPFFFAMVVKGAVRTGCWLRLVPLFRGRCPLHRRQVPEGPLAKAAAAAIDALTRRGCNGQEVSNG